MTLQLLVSNRMLFVFEKLLNIFDIQGVSKNTEQIWNRSQRREAAQSMKFFINIDCFSTYDVE